MQLITTVKTEMNVKSTGIGSNTNTHTGGAVDGEERPSMEVEPRATFSTSREFYIFFGSRGIN